MTKRFAISTVLILAGAGLMVTAFQNCGGANGGLSETPPPTATTNDVPAALTLVVPTTSITGGDGFTLSATGGTPPYQFSVVSGPGSIDAATGAFTSLATDSGTTVVRVTDSALATNDGVIGVSVNASTLITPGTATFNPSSAAQTFLVPNHNKITIRAWGAGGGGAGLGYIPEPDTGTDGGAGGDSQVTGSGLSILAGGGQGGTHGRVYYFNGSPGAGGDATGGNSKNISGANAPGQAGGKAGGDGGTGGVVTAGPGDGHTVGNAGVAPGGGAASTAYQSGRVGAISGGGGGGAYAESVLSKGALAPADSIDVVVGIGGVKGVGGYSANGGDGRVIIVWE